MNTHIVGTINSTLQNNFHLVKNFGNTKNSIKEQLFDTIRSVEKKFNISFDLKVEESPFGFTINNEYFYEFVMYPSNNNHDFRLTGPNFIKLDVKDFPFKFNDSNASAFEFHLDENFQVLSIVYASKSQYMKINGPILKINWLCFDKSLAFTNLKIKILEIKNKESLSTVIEKNKDMLMSFEEEAILFSLLTKNKEYVVEVLPEFINHGVYSFSQSDFKERLEIWKMMEL